jgi:Xaa-Pro aminopeptidase
VNKVNTEDKDIQIRWGRVQALMEEQQAEACLIASFVNIYYLTGRIFDGYVYVPREGEVIYFVRKAGTFEDSKTISIRKPEDIPTLLKDRNIPFPKILGLEADQLTYNEYIRLQKIFNPSAIINATTILSQSRMVKTPWEIEQIRYSAQQHAEVYGKITSLFQPGMTDLELQYEIERVMRQHGSIGIFRTFGSKMDVFMGTVLVGDNAAIPSPCDFALGGAGNYALPIGANGSLIKKGQSIVVDMAGNFTAYITDMTRVFSYGTLSDEAYRAHQTSRDMHNWLMENGKPGLSCSEIYTQSIQMAEKSGFINQFMGTVQQAKFVGHGVGIEINELPVLMGRSNDVLQPGMVVAYEPKFVLPETGAVGIENTYLVTASGIEKLTVFDENILPLFFKRTYDTTF